jgi:membrane protease YdiL (CAAX protease family)
MSKLEIKSSFIKNTKPIVSILKSILGFIGIYMVSAIIGGLCVILISTCVGINISGGDVRNNMLAQNIKLFGYVFFTVGTIMYCKFIEKRSMQSMGLIKKGFIINYLKGFIIGIILISAVLLISLASRALIYKGISNNIDGLAILLFLVGYIIQGMAEEVMCRGYLMTSLFKKTSMFWAILISSVVFTLPHLLSLFASGVQFITIGFVNTMLLSVFLSLFMIKGKNIWVICAIHSSWNYILGVFCGISVSGGETNSSILTFTTNEAKGLINGGIYGLEAGILTTVILIISIAILAFIMKRDINRALMKDYKHNL